MRQFQKKLRDGRIVVTREDRRDIRYCRIYLLDSKGKKVLDSDGPWPDGIAKEKHKEMIAKHSLSEIDVWTEAYTPFLMGGDVHAPLLTTVPAAGPFDLGKGFKGDLVTAPNGKTFVAEATTGAFVGPTIESVKKDVAGCNDIMMMKHKVFDAAELKKKARRVAPERFWSGLKVDKPVKAEGKSHGKGQKA